MHSLGARCSKSCARPATPQGFTVFPHFLWKVSLFLDNLVSEMKVIAEQALKDTVLQMDDHHFEDCTITQCLLVFSGGDFSWTNCKFVNCQIRFVGAAGKTLNFLKHFGMVPQALKRAETVGSSSVH